MKTVQELLDYLAQFKPSELIAVPVIWDKATAEAQYDCEITDSEWVEVVNDYLDAEVHYDASEEVMTACMENNVASYTYDE